MTFPEFPDSREILLSDKPVFDSIFATNPPELSAYTFTNIFAWRASYVFQVSRLGGYTVVVHHDHEGRKFCWEPLGSGDIKSAIIEISNRIKGQLDFTHISSSTAALFTDTPGFVAELDRNNSDYLYSINDLVKLAGRKFDAKRNYIKRFRSEYDYHYEAITQETAQECLEFASAWCDERSCKTEEGLMREYNAVSQMLTDFDSLQIFGGAIRVNGKIVAFSLGEVLNPDTLVVHVEKADTSFDGLYQLINNEFCTHEANGFKYVNREQDMGIPGLRKAKESYHPVKMVDSYKIRRD